MIDSKLVIHLRNLAKEEWKSLGNFLASPYFIRRKGVLPLFHYLRQCAPDFEAGKLLRTEVFKKLYPGAGYNEKELRYQMSYLTRAVEQFMAFEQLSRDEDQQQLYLLQQYVQRFPMQKAFNQHFQKMSQDLDKKMNRNASFYYLQHQLYDSGNRHFLSQRQRRYDDNLQKAADALDKYYMLQKIRYSCEMTSRQMILSQSYRFPFVKDIVDWPAQLDLKSDPLILLYLEIYKMLSTTDGDLHFEQLKQLLHLHGQALEKEELQEIFQYAINYCLTQTRRGRKYYMEEALKLYVEGIENDILTEKAYLSPWTYTNVVKLALRLEKYKWIEQFIYEYSKMLHLDLRKNIVKYNLAELFFYQNEYKMALEALTEVDFSDFNFHLGSRVLLSKIYYETGEEEALVSLLASFNNYLRRNRKISLQIKRTLLNYCQILHQLLRRHPGKMEGIASKISTTTLLTERDWLLDIWNREKKKMLS